MTTPDKVDVTEEMMPERYIEKVSLATGDVLAHEILPRQLLVHGHRDYHFVDVYARYMMSRVVKATGDEERARRKMKEVRALGHRTSRVLAKMIGQKDPEKVSKALFGLKDREYYFRYKKHGLSPDEIETILSRLKVEAAEKLAAVTSTGGPAIRVLLTGGTGFVGKEILWQAAHDDAIAEVVVVIRPKEILDRKTREVLQVLSPTERGEALMRQLWLETPEQRAKFRFIAGDVEEPALGVSAADLDELETRITHVIHCAASVAFDDPYEKSFRANVNGTLNALRLSHALQVAPQSPFVAHLSIETSYIHGRQTKQAAREDEIAFPRNFYNNYYELTKAMASLETERFMLDKGLRVVQLCPAIVIGDSKAGNNRGDTKVVNAPVNVFGRAQAALSAPRGKGIRRSKAAMLARLACVFPGDPSAQINLITVDRVVAGIVAALKRPQAVGERIHLASDNRVTSQEIRDIVEEELGVSVKLAEPTLHRTVTLPLLTKVLTRLNQERIARILEKLGTIFSGYSEWGQPVHEVGNDVTLLGLSEERPDSRRAFRMLCRHNRYVQDFGKIKDLDEISRRERIWWEFASRHERHGFSHRSRAIPGHRQVRAASHLENRGEVLVLAPQPTSSSSRRILRATRPRARSSSTTPLLIARWSLLFAALRSSSAADCSSSAPTIEALPRREWRAMAIVSASVVGSAA
jgi:nucleoside-diphosphate-sugar epimerase